MGRCSNINIIYGLLSYLTVALVYMLEHIAPSRSLDTDTASTFTAQQDLREELRALAPGSTASRPGQHYPIYGAKASRQVHILRDQTPFPCGLEVSISRNDIFPRRLFCSCPAFYVFGGHIVLRQDRRYDHDSLLSQHVINKSVVAKIHF